MQIHCHMHITCVTHALNFATSAMAEKSEFSPDFSVIKRVFLAAKQIPKETPSYWDLVARFGFKHATEKPTAEKVRVLVENTQFLDSEALTSDDELLKELIKCDGFDGKPLGIVLVSNNTVCKLCEGKLLVRADRPSFLMGYTSLSTVPVTHFRKFCHKSSKGCSFTQHYGFHCIGEGTSIVYDEDWADLPFFVSTQKTTFETKLLKQFNAELLIGQVSYNQRCDIYNYVHGYEDRHKATPALNEAPSSEVCKSQPSIVRYILCTT